MSRRARLTARSDISTALALCSDRALRELVDAAAPIGSGIGGKSALLEVAGTRVFVKRLPLTDGDEAANRALIMVEKELEAGTSFMNARGLLHFDAHFENILTDGQRLYFADYGLAISSRFELSQGESRFFDQHLTYDRCYTATHLVRWLATALYGCQGDDRDALVLKYAEGERPEGIPEAAAAILTRHAPLAAVMSDFYRKLQRQSRNSPYPLEKIRKLDGMYSSSIG